MNACLPQASYPCDSFSGLPAGNSSDLKGSIGHAFTVCIRIENVNQATFFPFGPREVFRSGGAVQRASLFLCHFRLSLVLYQ